MVSNVPVVIKSSSQLTPLETTRMALSYATRLGHSGMIHQLSVRLKTIEDENYLALVD